MRDTLTLQVDAHTVEVADYTVVVKGLPELDPIEVCWLRRVPEPLQC